MNLPVSRADRVGAALGTGLGVSAPPSVSIMGGQFALVDSAGVREQLQTTYLDCLVLDASDHVNRVFWGVEPNGHAKTFDPNSSEPPTCFSDNGVGASANAQVPQSTNCQTCQWNAWNSAISNLTGRGVKACNQIKKVAVVALKQVDQQTWAPVHEMSFLLRVPIMSHQNLLTYSKKFAGQPFNITDVVTRVSFVPAAVGQLDFTAVGFVDPTKQGSPITDLREKLWASNVTDALVGRGDVPATQALGGPASAPAIAAPPAQAAPAAIPAPQAPQFQQPPASTPAQTSAPAPAPARRGRQPRAPAPQAPAEPARAPFMAQQPPGGLMPPNASAPLTPQQPQAPQGAPFGIATQAPPPPPPNDLEAALAKTFDLKLPGAPKKDDGIPF